MAVLVAAPPPARAAEVTIREKARSQCFGGYLEPSRGDAATAAALMRGRLTMPPHPEVSIPVDLDWTEDPLGDENWRFNLHTLRWTDVLRREFERTGAVALRDRQQSLLRDWIADNPRQTPPSPYSYSDMAVGVRAIVLACAIATYGPEGWLLDALRAHGTVLSDPAFGAQKGNHALHVRNGLLVAGCVLGNPDWVSSATQRIASLLSTSVDAAGVTDEGSTTYQAANYSWYSESRRRLMACGVQPSSTFDRVALMPDFLAHATTPEATYEQIGDSDRTKAVAIAGTTLEYAATQGARGVKPTGVFNTYDRGYVFGRSGWGERRPFARRDVLLAPLRTADEAAGPRALRRGGADPPRLRRPVVVRQRSLHLRRRRRCATYMVSRAAHNTVDVPGARKISTEATPLVARQHTANLDLVTVRNTSMAGSTWTRTVLYSRTGNYLVVDDRLQSSEPVESVQRWHVPTGRTFHRTAATISTSGSGADVRFFWLGASPPAVSTAEGRENPVLGWRSYVYGDAFPSPVIEARSFGASARYTTVIVPRGAGPVPPVKISDARVSANFVTANITLDGRTEAVRLRPTSASVTPVE